MEQLQGRVEAVHVYPVKSLAGRSVTRAEIEPAGLRGDRVYAVVDVATAERVRARTEPALDGVAAIGDPDVDAATVTAVLGRPVRLESAGAGPQVDVAAVHLVSRQALDRATVGDVPGDCSAEDPRANLVLALDRPDADERSWVGRQVRIGAAVLRLTRLPKHCLGVYAEVVESGPVSVGDPVRLAEEPQR